MIIFIFLFQVHNGQSWRAQLRRPFGSGNWTDHNGTRGGGIEKDKGTERSVDDLIEPFGILCGSKNIRTSQVAIVNH